MKLHRCLLLLALLAPFAQPALAQSVLNLYSARHYQTDEALYANFTKQTGIRINRIEAKEEELLERLRTEGANSPADVLITVDATRLAIADERGLFAPAQSKVLEERIPAHLRNGNWFAFSMRARVIVFNKLKFNATDIGSYEDLALPKFKGQVCSRSGAHPYNLSLLASIVAHHGEAKAQEWAAAVVSNFARPARGGDTDQIKSVAAGECGVAVSNSYYFARMMRSRRPDDRKVIEAVGLIWPNQSSFGTHVNISGGGMLKHAPNKDAAVKFLEYLTSDDAQRYFADGNNEWPVVPGVSTDNPALAALGQFKADTLPTPTLAKNLVTAQKIADRAGWR